MLFHAVNHTARRYGTTPFILYRDRFPHRVHGKFEMETILAYLRKDEVPAVIIFGHVNVCPGDRHLVAITLSR